MLGKATMVSNCNSGLATRDSHLGSLKMKAVSSKTSKLIVTIFHNFSPIK